MNKMKLFLSALFFTALLIAPTNGQHISIQPNVPGQSINDVITFLNTNPGFADTLILETDGGIYPIFPAEIQVPLVIRGNDGTNNKPIIVTHSTAGARVIWPRNDLTLKDLIIDGYDAATTTYDSIRYIMQISTTAGSFNETPDIKVYDCEIRNVYRYANPEFSEDGNIFDIATTARCGDVIFERTTLANTGDEALRSINTHKTPVALDNKCWDSFTVRNCTFKNIRGSSIKIESDGDSTTVDGDVFIENNTFYGCYRRVIWEREFANSVMRNLLITYSITGNDATLGGAGTLVSFQREGSTLANVDSFACQRIVGLDTVKINDGAYRAETPSSWSFCSQTGTIDLATLYGIDPQFVDPTNGNFTIPQGNTLLTLGHDGLAIGDRRWTGQLTGIKEINNGQVPSDFSLSQNFPNPFNPQTKIQFTLAKPSNVSLIVYNVVGEEVTKLVNEFKNSGSFEYTFDSAGLSSGVYFYTLKTDNFVSTKKMIVMK